MDHQTLNLICKTGLSKIKMISNYYSTKEGTIFRKISIYAGKSSNGTTTIKRLDIQER